MYQLKSSTGKIWDIEGFTLVGRNPDKSIMETANLLVIVDDTKTISKTHAALAVNKDGQLLVEDLESTNGTFITGDGEYETQVMNGSPKIIASGEHIRLGDVVFEVQEVSANAI
jgi:pSer/pThr/pTyr-binding forkhead associated (FHA) protein